MKRIFIAVLVSTSLLILTTRPANCQTASQPAPPVTGQEQKPENKGQTGAATAPAQTATTTPVQLDEKSAKIKGLIVKYGLGGTVSVRLNNDEELYGSILYINDEEFTVFDVDIKRRITVQYKNVKKVWEGYGGKVITGKRENPRHGLFIGLGILGALIILIAVSLPKS